MAVKSSAVLKSYFNTGDVPTESNFDDLIDSTIRGVATTTQPAFMAFKSSASTDVTGDGTEFVIVCDTEVFDQASNYNNASGVFAAPITGVYQFTAFVTASQLAAGHSCQLSLNSGVREHYARKGFVIATDTLEITTLILMTAGDTVSTKIIVSGGSKVVDINGNATISFTYFCGHLVC